MCLQADDEVVSWSEWRSYENDDGDEPVEEELWRRCYQFILNGFTMELRIYATKVSQ